MGTGLGFWGVFRMLGYVIKKVVVTGYLNPKLREGLGALDWDPYGHTSLQIMN